MALGYPNASIGFLKMMVLVQSLKIKTSSMWDVLDKLL